MAPSLDELLELALLADEMTISDDEENLKKFECSKKRCGQESGTSISSIEASLHSKVLSELCTLDCATDTATDISFKQIHEHMRFGGSDNTGLEHLYSNHWMKPKKLNLVLDLDHTLINSSNIEDLTVDEIHLVDQASMTKDAGSLHRLDFNYCSMLVKLRPFVRQFLEEANTMFDLYVYTMGTWDYAAEVVKILDPENKYFTSKVISREDCTQSGVKALDIVPGSKACTIILDDTLSVWTQEDRENIIEIWKYNFFASSSPDSYSRCKTLTQKRTDERETDGTLGSILSVLKDAYWEFLLMDDKQSGLQPDFRRILKEMRNEILRGCLVAFTGVPRCGLIPLWQVAEQLGAKCSTVVDSSATHVLAVHCSPSVAEWALENGKFLVHVNWLESARFLWR
ncbi:C-terminal domain phosphatase-like 4 [Rhynchospora pubera]|uniref:RNA polymerase II C-terminal domain phosphatase-like n=1 Tax=Rhynchospora pubera TaxID=906938 RepID=A0AAV8D6W9_9POAL|nr:C-terminal domain phosphatase-like 4 [Rhynchospora pubera]